MGGTGFREADQQGGSPIGPRNAMIWHVALTLQQCMSMKGVVRAPLGLPLLFRNYLKTGAQMKSIFEQPTSLAKSQLLFHSGNVSAKMHGKIPLQLGGHVTQI